MGEMIFTAFKVHEAQVIAEIISKRLGHYVPVWPFRVLCQAVEILRKLILRELIFFIVVRARAEF